MSDRSIYTSMIQADIRRLEGEQALAYRQFKAEPTKLNRERKQRLSLQLDYAKLLYRKACKLDSMQS
jgi:hypothetical protein